MLRMLFIVEVVNITKHPLTAGLFSAISIAILLKDLSNLVRPFEIALTGASPQSLISDILCMTQDHDGYPKN